MKFIFAGWHRPSSARLPKVNVYDDIKPLKGFRWQHSHPLKLRLFKPIYHLTMGSPSTVSNRFAYADKLRPSICNNVRLSING
jgi:hypothetical protein